jgi:hypothetical protein
MIYSIVGTGMVKREKAYEALEKVGEPGVHIYSEQIASLQALISSTSLFGDTIVANLIQTMDVAASRDEVTRLLPDMKDSSNIFIIDEPFADANRVKKLEKYSEKLYDAREEKKEGVDVFKLCNLFGRRDKKEAWLEWMRIRDLESPEAIQGLLWWKMKTIWEDTLNGKPSKYTKAECEHFASRIVRSSMDAHRGEKDLKVELEAILLSI